MGFLNLVQEIATELKIWVKLSHRNVLPILGYVKNWSGSVYPSFVSPWMENGSLRSYMKENDVNVPIMVSHSYPILGSNNSFEQLPGFRYCLRFTLSTLSESCTCGFEMRKQC